jgi:hypothetical protein
MNKLLSKDEIKNQNALIGEFLIGFEQICAAIRFTILNVLFPNYSEVQNNNVEILLTDLTGYPLIKKLEALIQYNYSEEKDLLTLNKKLSDVFCKMNGLRNSIIHGSKLIGWKSFSGDLSSETLLLKHSKIVKSGFDRNSMIINISEIRKLIKQIQLLGNAYLLLHVLVDKMIPVESKVTYLKELKATIESVGDIKLGFEDKVTR